MHETLQTEPQTHTHAVIFKTPYSVAAFFYSNNQFSTSCRISKTVSKWLESDQTLMLNAIPQQQVLNTNLISVSRGQTSAWCLLQPALPAGGEQRQQQYRRMHGRESSSQNQGRNKCTEQDCDILPNGYSSRSSSLFHMCKLNHSSGLWPSDGRFYAKCPPANSQGILHIFKAKEQLNVAVP